MIKIENVDVSGWEAAIRGMRNPMNSWDKGDSYYGCGSGEDNTYPTCGDICIDKCRYIIGDNDLLLMKRLVNAGTDHRKFLRMINVTMDITAPLYWWKEFDTYKVGTVANSCSTMHKIAAKEFTLEDFSCDFLLADEPIPGRDYSSLAMMEATIYNLNRFRDLYLQTKDKKYWWQMIQLLPSSYNQRRTAQLNYEVLANIYKSRKNHKLDEWSVGFMKWIESLPYSELITGKEVSDNETL